MHRNSFSSITRAVLTFVFASAGFSHAACVPKSLPTPAPQDPVARVLSQQNGCPKNAMEFVDTLKRAGARLEPTMVNFVGAHNPDAGAFFIFEIVSLAGSASPSRLTIQRGDMLFGHFTVATGDGRLISNQSDLVIELIAWDPDKQFYN